MDNSERELKKYQRRIAALQKLEAQKEKRKKFELEKLERQKKRQEDMCDFHADQGSWLAQVPDAPIYRPTPEEFKDPLAYIRSIQHEASNWGVCKIIPPVTPAVPATTVLNKVEGKPFKFTTRQQLVRERTWESFDSVKFFQSEKKYTVAEYEKFADEYAKRRFGTGALLPSRFIEAEYWRTMTDNETQTFIEYGNDVEGSAFCSTDSRDPLASTRWNLQVLPKDELSTLRLLQGEVPGVTSPMLYIGMLFATFAWHVEDHYLYSINYQHMGASKTWYGVPASSADGFEEAALASVYGTAVAAQLSEGKSRKEAVTAAHKALIAKTTMFSPRLLLEKGVRVCRAVQAPGEYIVTFPRAYHGGFSNGFCVGEAVNFGMGDWFLYGADAMQRYRRVQQPPILPQEQLLCLEALELKERLDAHDDGSETSAPLSDDLVATIQRSFVTFMREQNVHRASLHKRDATFQPYPGEASMPCCVCKQLSYLASVTAAAELAPLPRCVGCAARDPSFGPDCRVFVRRSIGQLEALARRFEAALAENPAPGGITALQEGGLTEAAHFPEGVTPTGAPAQPFDWAEEAPMDDPAAVTNAGYDALTQGLVALLASEAGKEPALQEQQAEAGAVPALPQAPAASAKVVVSGSEAVRTCGECGRTSAASRFHDQQAGFCSPTCAGMVCARAAGQHPAALSAATRHRSAPRASSPKSTLDQAEAAEESSSREEGESRAVLGKRRRTAPAHLVAPYAQSAPLPPPDMLNTPDTPLVAIEHNRVPVAVNAATNHQMMVTRHIFQLDNGVRYIPGLDLVKAAGHPQTVSASRVLEDWYRAILQKAALCQMGAAPALFPRAYCKGLKPGSADKDGTVYMVGSEDLTLIAWVLDGEERQKVARFVKGVWPDQEGPLGRLDFLLELEANAKRAAGQEAAAQAAHDQAPAVAGNPGWESASELEERPLFEILSAREIYELLCKYSHLMDDVQMRQMVKRVALRKVQQQQQQRQAGQLQALPPQQQQQQPRLAPGSGPPKPQPQPQQQVQQQQQQQAHNDEGRGRAQAAGWDEASDLQQQTATAQFTAQRETAGSAAADQQQLASQLEEAHWRQQRMLAACRQQQKNGLGPDGTLPFPAST